MNDDLAARGRNWSTDELRVLVAIYFNSAFAIGDDARDECRAIADCLGRTPSSIDRQWRNVAAVVRGTPGYNIGQPVRDAVGDYLANPVGARTLAHGICVRRQWPLESLISEGRHELAAQLPTEDLDTEIRSALRHLADRLEYKLFASGSQGFFQQGKLHITGHRYQGQVTAVLIGSKNDLSASVRASVEELAYAIAPLVQQLNPKTFRTGRVGYYATGKLQVGAERYQVALQAVEISQS